MNLDKLKKVAVMATEGSGHEKDVARRILAKNGVTAEQVLRPNSVNTPNQTHEIPGKISILQELLNDAIVEITIEFDKAFHEFLGKE